MSRSQRKRGVSLIEALVALGVMAFGILGVMGMQVTLRSNSDMSRQRAEAVRIAQETIEDWRGISGIEANAAAGVVDYTDLVSDGPTVVPGDPLFPYNATYMRTRTVTGMGSLNAADMRTARSLLVRVSWQDRSGQTQEVQLSSVIGGVAPELAGSLALPPHGVPARQPLGRNRTIPALAKDLGSVSGFMPPQPAGGGVTWVFNNVSGLITGLCNLPARTTETLVAADVAGCSANTLAQLLSGYVQFASTAAAPDASQAEVPTGLPLNLDISLALNSTLVHPAPPSCFDNADAVAAAAQPGAAVAYYCAIFSNADGKWQGRSRVVPAGWVIGTAAGLYEVCRYTRLTTDNPANAKNADHPLDYTESGSAAFASLTGQNFLVISSAHTCPTDVAADPSAGNFVNSNTLLHQDGTVTYSN